MILLKSLSAGLVGSRDLWGPALMDHWKRVGLTVGLLLFLAGTVSGLSLLMWPGVWLLILCTLASSRGRQLLSLCTPWGHR